MDPDGEAWFNYQASGENGTSWHWHKGSTYNLNIGIDENGNKIFRTLQGHQAVVVFNGSIHEKLGEGQNLFGKGAILADVTVYGPKGPYDIGYYKGFSMSSDFSKWGAIANGVYEGNYDVKGKSGALKSNWTINNRWKVPVLGGINPSPYRSFVDSKIGVFIHSSNKNGFAGNYFSRNGKLHGISEGCLLITPTQYNSFGNVISVGWNEFNDQLQGTTNFLLEVRRKN